MGISRPKTVYIKAFATIFLRNSNGFYYNLLSILFPLCKKISREMFASFLYDTLFFGKNQLSVIFFSGALYRRDGTLCRGSNI